MFVSGILFWIYTSMIFIFAHTSNLTNVQLNHFFDLYYLANHKDTLFHFHSFLINFYQLYFYLVYSMIQSFELHLTIIYHWLDSSSSLIGRLLFSELQTCCDGYQRWIEDKQAFIGCFECLIIWRHQGIGFNKIVHNFKTRSFRSQQSSKNQGS